MRKTPVELLLVSLVMRCGKATEQELEQDLARDNVLSLDVTVLSIVETAVSEGFVSFDSKTRIVSIRDKKVNICNPDHPFDKKIGVKPGEQWEHPSAKETTPKNWQGDILFFYCRICGLHYQVVAK